LFQKEQILLKIGSDRINFFFVALSKMYKALFAFIQNILNENILSVVPFSLKLIFEAMINILTGN